VKSEAELEEAAEIILSNAIKEKEDSGRDFATPHQEMVWIVKGVLRYLEQEKTSRD